MEINQRLRRDLKLSLLTYNICEFKKKLLYSIVAAVERETAHGRKRRDVVGLP